MSDRRLSVSIVLDANCADDDLLEAVEKAIWDAFVPLVENDTVLEVSHVEVEIEE